MLTNLINMLNHSVTTPAIKTPVLTPQFQTTSSTKNPFITGENYIKTSYGKNNPVAGGYFAGYYNGKPNIVGSRLFVEV